MCVSTAQARTKCGPRFASVHFSLQAQYFVDLDEKVAETRSLWLCACRIAPVVARCALVVVQCELWNRSRKPLGTLCVSDPSRCGAVLIFRWLCAILVKSPDEFSGKCFMAQSAGSVVYEDRDHVLAAVLVMLWRSWWNPVRGPCTILHGSLLVGEDLVEIPAKSSP